MSMHEYSLVQALLERVERIAVRIGDLAGVERDLFATAFRTFTVRTICEGAELEIVPVAAEWKCPRCERPIDRGAVLRCSNCDVPASLAAGGDLVLDRIQMEVPDV
jgi:Zn finger protein HypA/HybF involved in hydrogenase expression